MVPSSSANTASSAKSAKKPATSPRFHASYIRRGMVLKVSMVCVMRSSFRAGRSTWQLNVAGQFLQVRVVGWSFV
jgi:hypothetical protein